MNLWTIDLFIVIALFAHVAYVGYKNGNGELAFMYSVAVVIGYGFVTYDVLGHMGLIAGALLVYITSHLTMRCEKLGVFAFNAVLHFLAVCCMYGAHFAMWDESMVWSVPMFCLATLAWQLCFLYKGDIYG